MKRRSPLKEREWARLIADLEHANAESVYRPTAEALIADLMERTFKSTDQGERVRLAALEMRARLILKRWKVRNAN